MTMSRDEAYEWIRNGPRWGRLATIGRDGFPHNVPLSYWMHGEDVVVNVRGQRLANIRRNPKVCFVIDTGSSMADLKGVVLKATATIVEDDAERLELAREGMRRRGTAEADLPTSVEPGRLYARMHIESIASWDYASRR